MSVNKHVGEQTWANKQPATGSQHVIDTMDCQN